MHRSHTRSLGPEGLRKLWKLQPAPQATSAGMKLKSLFAHSFSPQMNSNTPSSALVSLAPQAVKSGQLVGDFKCQWTSNRERLPIGDNSISKMEAQTPWSRDRGLAYPWQQESGRGTHHSWNLSTQTGSLPSPPGMWGQRCGGTSPRAAGTESHRTCTWGGAGRAANGSRCCCGGSPSGTCGQEERLSSCGREKQSAQPLRHPLLPVLMESVCHSGSGAAGLSPTAHT